MKSKRACNQTAYSAILFLLFFCVSLEADSFQSPLRTTDERSLLRYARAVLEATIAQGKSMTVADPQLPPVPNGIFITLTKNHQVRGCYGSLFPQGQPLYSEVREFVIAAATSDFRHSPVRASELKDIVIVISFIGAMEPVANISEIDPKTQGLLLRSGDHAAVLLPGEARTASWQIKEAKRQAGIGPGETGELFRIHTATLYER